MKHLRSFGFLIWLALALAMGQQAAALHDLGHATERIGQKQDSKPAPAKCAECGLYAEFSGALAAKAAVAPIVMAVSPRAADVAIRSATLATRLAFRSQAPPTLL